MRKAREIFDMALALINERDSSGAYHSDVEDFEKNATSMITLLNQRLLYLQCHITGRDISNTTWDRTITSLDDPLTLNDKILLHVMPYALASMLILEEDSQRSAYFYSLFKDAEEKVMREHKKGKRKSITNVY